LEPCNTKITSRSLR